ncbi:hypothetical protein D3C71_1195620 [compost metagenome]
MPAEYLSVPSPTEIRVGDIVTFNDEDAGKTLYRVDTLRESGANCTIIYSDVDFYGVAEVGGRAYGGDFSWARIIDDSREEDTASARKEVAA